MQWARRLLGGDGAEPNSEREQLLARLAADPRLSRAAVEAIAAVPRELFVAPEGPDVAYQDIALQIGPSATISAPSMVAEMLTALDLRPGQLVLEIGAGSGYAAACMAALGARVVGIELLPELAVEGRRHLTEAGFADQVDIVPGDGRAGWPDRAPVDRVLVSAAVEAVPPAWMEQLKPAGLLVYPEAGPSDDILVRLTKLPEGGWRREELGRCRFVRLQG